MSENIIELAKNFARAPSRYPELFDPRKPLPENVSELLEVISGAPATRIPGLTPESIENNTELNEAISFFLEKILFVGGADYYRVLGLNSGASIDQIRRNYELLINMFYQDKGKGMIQWNEANFVKINRALNTLRDPEKRIKYDRELDSKRSGVSWPPAEDLIKGNDGLKNSNPQDPSNISRLNTNKRKLPKILIVDSSTELRAGLSRVLKREFECVYANNGVQGWEFLKKNNNFHLLITELNMPQLDGYMLIKKIRSNDNKRLSNLPIIVITGIQDTRAKQKAFAAGANDFLSKSTDYIEMLARVRVHYKLAETTKKLEQSAEKPTEILKKIKSIKRKVGDPSSAMNTTSKSLKLMVNVSDSVAEKKHITRVAPMFTIVVGGLASVVIVGLLYLTQIGPDSSPHKGASLNSASNLPDQDKDKKNVRVPSLDGKVMMGSLESDQGNGQGGSFGVITRQTYKFKNPKAEVSTPDSQKKSNSSAKEPIKVASTTPARKMDITPAKVETTRVGRAQPQSEINTVKSVDQEMKPVPKTPIKSTDVNSSFQRTSKSTDFAPERLTKAKDLKKTSGDVTKNLSSRSVEPVVLPPVALTAATATPPISAAPKITSDQNKTTDVTKTVAKLNPPPQNKNESKGFKQISDRDLAILIFEFVRAYEEGNLNNLLKVFDKNVQSTDGTSITSIQSDYKTLFDSTEVRHFDIPDLVWQKTENKATGSGNYLVKIRSKSEKELRKFTGKITIEAQKNDNGLLITGFFH